MLRLRPGVRRVEIEFAEFEIMTKSVPLDAVPDAVKRSERKYASAYGFTPLDPPALPKVSYDIPPVNAPEKPKPNKPSKKNGKKDKTNDANKGR